MADTQENNFEEMARAFEARYERLEVAGVAGGALGEGAYGTVYKARDTESGMFVALKKMKLEDEDEGVPSTAIREVAVLKRLKHVNVVNLLDVFCSTTKMILVFEFLENDLKKFMRSHNRFLDPSTIKSFCFQLCKGIEFCHANRVMHRDLKPSNLLVDSSVRLKIADFGLAREYMLPIPKYTQEVVTVWYRPLEILLGSTHYSLAVDMWGVGCILAEMATGHPLFYGDSQIDTIFKICQKLGTPTEETWPGVQDMPDFKPTWPKWEAKGWDNIRNTKAQLGAIGVDLLEQFMVYDARKRISARRALQHQYFADVVLPEGVSV